MQRRMLCFCTVDLVLRPRDLLLGLLQLENRLLQLRLQFRDFKDGECLPFMNDVANIHINARHVAAHLGVYIHNLVGLELSGQRKHLGDITPLRRGDLRRCDRRSSRF